MKKLIIVLVIVFATGLFAKSNFASMFKKIGRKLLIKNTTNQVTVVAGVRGADVRKQRAHQLKNTLYWEE